MSAEAVTILIMYLIKITNILMKALKWLWHKTLTYKFFDVFVSGYYYISDIFLIGETLYSKEFWAVIKNYINIDLKKDWIGRLYGIMNPNINKEGMYDFNKTIIEIDGENTNNTEYVKYYVYKQMHLISDLFKINRLYDYINLSFEHVGPENQDNYLVVFDIVTRKLFAQSIKSFSKQLLCYIIIAATFIGGYYLAF